MSNHSTHADHMILFLLYQGSSGKGVGGGCHKFDQTNSIALVAFIVAEQIKYKQVHHIVIQFPVLG